jgi:hypothetical protein
MCDRAESLGERRETRQIRLGLRQPDVEASVLALQRARRMPEVSNGASFTSS